MKIDNKFQVRSLDYYIIGGLGILLLRSNGRGGYLTSGGLGILLLTSNGRGGYLTSVSCFLCGHKVIIGPWLFLILGCKYIGGYCLGTFLFSCYGFLVVIQLMTTFIRFCKQLAISGDYCSVWLFNFCF